MVGLDTDLEHSCCAEARRYFLHLSPALFLLFQTALQDYYFYVGRGVLRLFSGAGNQLNTLHTGNNLNWEGYVAAVF